MLCHQTAANYQGIKWFYYFNRTAKKSKGDYLNKTVPLGKVILHTNIRKIGTYSKISFSRSVALTLT